MSLFKDILSKLGIGHDDTQPTTTTATPTPPGSAAPVSVDGGVPPMTGTTTPRTDTTVDVGAKLDGLANEHAEKLNWRTSVVDLLKLLGIDSSLQHRKELATELNCPADKLNDSAEMNMWLHKAVLQKISANGGTVPSELL